MTVLAPHRARPPRVEAALPWVPRLDWVLAAAAAGLLDADAYAALAG